MADINDPQKLFAYKLGVALYSERKILTLLGKIEQKVQRDDLKQQFAHHREETEGQIQNIEQAFRALGQEPAGHTSPTFDGLAREAEEMLGKVPDELTDAVILGGAADTEHLEIALYESLITKAEAMGEEDIVSLLQENLEQEQHTLKEVKQYAERLDRELATQTA